VQPRENPGYAYKFAHPWKNPAGAHSHYNTINTQTSDNYWKHLQRYGQFA